MNLNTIYEILDKDQQDLTDVDIITGIYQSHIKEQKG